MTDDSKDLAALRAITKLLDTQRRILIDAHADPDIVRVLGALTRHLFNLPDAQALRIINGSRHGSLSAARRLSDAPKMAALSLKEVESLTENPKTPRTILESIAVGRFQVPRGSLRSLGNIDQLREKIQTMARNEEAHATIAEVAKDGPD